MKTAKELKVGNKVKCGDLISAVKVVRIEIRGSGGETVHHITIEGQPEISSWNLQKFFDHGGFEVVEA